MFVVLILIFAISACTTIVPAATATHIPSPTATTIPSATPTRVPTATLTPDPFAVAERINYDFNNDIWIKVPGTTENGKPYYFVFQGIKGQEIRLYFEYPVYTGNWIDETNIFDINGNALPAERFSDAGGWKGKLPSTQNYLIQLIPADNSKAEFVMQFVNTPPRKESGYFIYNNKQIGFEITYSQDDFKPAVKENLNDVFSVTLDVDKYFAGTILHLSSLMISTEPRSPSSDCYDPLADMYYSTKETINGIAFKKYALHDAATGTEAELVYYLTAHNDRCYQIFLRTLYMRVDKYPDTGLKDFSRSILYTKYYRLLSTFRFLE